MIKRGQRLFLLLASLIVINEVGNVILTIVSGTSISTWFKPMFMPLLILWTVWNVWSTGDRWARLSLGILVLAKGLLALWVFGLLMIRMAEITPPTEARFFWEISAALFAFPAIHASLLIVIGLVICCSPSIRAFLETRMYRQNPIDD